MKTSSILRPFEVATLATLAVVVVCVMGLLLSIGFRGQILV
jgi:hypothetical protein